MAYSLEQRFLILSFPELLANLEKDRQLAIVWLLLLWRQ